VTSQLLTRSLIRPQITQINAEQDLILILFLIQICVYLRKSAADWVMIGLMKVCIKCNAQFPDTERFCEIDGSPLFSAADLAAIGDRRGVAPRPATVSNRILVAVAIGGVVIGALLFLVYLVMTRMVETGAIESNSNSNVAQQQTAVRPVVPVAEASVTPLEEPSPSPSVEPSPSPQSTATPIQLSSNPISTARASGQSGPVIIRLNSGVTIEADEAWQTGEGIWYRKSSVLTLLDPKDVKAIEKVAPPTPSPPTPSPSP